MTERDLDDDEIRAPHGHDSKRESRVGGGEGGADVVCRQGINREGSPCLFRARLLRHHPSKPHRRPAQRDWPLKANAYLRKWPVEVAVARLPGVDAAIHCTE